METRNDGPVRRPWPVIGAAAAVVAVVAVVAAVVASAGGGPEHAAPQDLSAGTATPPVTGTGRPSPSASASPVPPTTVVSRTGQPVSRATTAPPGDGGGAGPDEGPTMSPAERLEDCKWSVGVTSVSEDGWVSVEWGDHEKCPPEAEGWVFWASYAMAPDGSGLLFDMHEYRLSDADRHVDFFVHTVAACRTWFVVRGNVAPKSTLTAAQMHSNGDPYGGNSIHYTVDQACQVD